MSAAKRSILIIDDDAVVAGIYRSKFERAGYTAEVALDGQAGFYRVMELRPNALLLDLMLPNIDGLDILKKIRAQKQFGRMPILVLTNSFLSEVALDAAKSGATEVFDKATATPEHLIEAANKALYLPLAHGISPSPEKPAAAPTGPAPIPPAARAPTPSPRPRAALPPRSTSEAAGPASSFLETAAQNLAQLRKNFQVLARETGDSERLEQLSQLRRKIHSISSHAAVEELRIIAQFASALEALVESLRLAPQNLNPSTIATLASSIDFLGELFENGRMPAIESPQPSNILVVDDQEVPRRNVVRALSTVKLSAISTESPEQALKLLSENRFDLVFLDVEMPGMSGFDLCARLRKLPLHRETPVVFVTALTEFQAKVRSKLSGGNEFIAKPFLIIELAVKALRHVLRQRLKLAAA
ncbi:MAG: response regulator [Verrucomicrobia bacterium]|nr:response regulator [Verrucomicrobiota bacterium]